MPATRDGSAPARCESLPAHRLFDRFAAQAALRPDAPAATGSEKTLTLAALRAEALQLAAGLRQRGIGPGDCVGLHLPRGVMQIVSLLALMRLGASYVPLDPAQPGPRLAQMTMHADPALVLSESALQAPALAGRPRVDLDDGSAWRGVEPLPAVDQGPDALGSCHAGHTLYTIFTSGSTGEPKGVQVSYGAAAWLLDALESSGVARAPHARVGWNASIGFDASVQQWIRLLRGDHLLVIDEPTRRDPQALVEFVHHHRLDDLDLTPTHAQVLLDELERRPRQGLRLIVGGEAISPALWTRLKGLARYGMEAVNVYGPTETTVDATFAPLTLFDAPTIGRALPGVTCRVVDARLQPVAVGEVGGLALGGPGLAQGYIGRAGLTAARFVPDAGGPPGARLYLTGDLVRQRADGTFAFLGRSDQQVKVHGHRIELGEVEAALLSHPDVRAAGVVARADGSALLAAVVLARPGAADDLHAHVAARLPGPMRPAHFATCERLPLTPSGKLDRQRVQALFATPADVAPPAADVRRANGGEPIRERIAGIWQEVLRRDVIEPDDDFFALGGNSLAAMQVSSRLQSLYQRRIPTRHLFEHPTLAAYTDVVRARLQA